jgi:hypothetical protein
MARALNASQAMLFRKDFSFRGLKDASGQMLFLILT